MKNSKVLKVILFISGLVAISVGGGILIMPESFYAASGINLNGNVSLLNEVRASGGMIFVVGVIIMAGVYITKLTYAATIVSILLYLTYALSRLMSMVIDGIPAEALIQAVILEIIIGLLCVFAFMKYTLKDN